MIDGLSHITIAVSNLEKSLAFYADLLKFVPVVRWDGGAYLEAGNIWLCLSVDTPVPGGDYSHIALRVNADNQKRCMEEVSRLGIPTWKENISEGESIYILDPDGHKIELHEGGLESRLHSLKVSPYDGLKWLD